MYGQRTQRPAGGGGVHGGSARVGNDGGDVPTVWARNDPPPGVNAGRVPPGSARDNSGVGGESALCVHGTAP